MIYIYESHTGNLYGSETWKDSGELYCEICDDFDRELGCADNPEDVLKILADDIDVPKGFGGWNLNSVLEFVRECFPDSAEISKQQATEIILKSRTRDD